MRKKLPDVTLVCIDCVRYGDAVHAIQESLKQVEPAEVIFFTDVDFRIDGIRTEIIPHLYSKADYSKFCMKDLGRYKFKTSHILVIQWDGYVINGEEWTDEFLKYSYVGAPWLYTDGHNTGNGGCSLRSVHLHQCLSKDDFILPMPLEDDAICRTYRSYLEQQFGIKFAPEELADKFSFELKEPAHPTFGFHGHFHKPYIKEPIVFRRVGAMGDVVAIEPVMKHFHKLGHPIILDSPYYSLFARHFYPIKDYKNFDHARIKHRLIDLNSAYEVKPKQPHLKSYFEVSGATDYKLERPQLRYQVDDATRLFKRYCVIHIDDRDTIHRNINGVDWRKVKNFIEDLGITVIQIGKGEHENVGLHLNTVNELFLMWVLGGMEFGIFVDSGPACIAVALNKKAIISFGSVNSDFIHPDLSNVQVIQSKCPIDKDGCWSEHPGTRGSECAVDNHNGVPPCTLIPTQTIIEAIKRIV